MKHEISLSFGPLRLFLRRRPLAAGVHQFVDCLRACGTVSRVLHRKFAFSGSHSAQLRHEAKHIIQWCL